jgi:hypothetical protein
MVILRYIQMHQINPPAPGRFAKSQNQNRVRICPRPMRSPPSLHDHLIRNEQQISSSQLAAKRRKFLPNFPANFRRRPRKPRVFARIKISAIKFRRRSRKHHGLLNDGCISHRRPAFKPSYIPKECASPPQSHCRRRRFDWPASQGFQLPPVQTAPRLVPAQSPHRAPCE